jgi:2,5-furandicarboxylate decarboxylase 1
MTKDLRSFLDELESQPPTEFAQIAAEVDPNLQLTGLIRRLQADGRHPVLLFERVKGTPVRVVANTMATRDRLGFLFGCSGAEVVETYMARQNELTPPVKVSDGPVREVVLTGVDANVLELPQIVHCGDDAGAYFSSGVILARDPDTGTYNAGIYRTQLVGPRKVRVYPSTATHLRYLYNKAEARGQALDVAWVLGHHPALLLAAQYRGPIDIDEIEVAGGLFGEPLRMLPAETVDLDVPADAEIVVEGRILPGIRESEGPFGEFTGTLGPAEMNPIAEITAITRRRDAIYLDVFNAHAEHNLMGMIPREALLYERVRAATPTVKAVTMPLSGTCRFTAYVSMARSHPGATRQAAMAAFASDSFLKQVVVVDDDIDVFNEAEVLWAVATRVQADRDITVIPDAWTNELDPSAHQLNDRTTRGGVNAKWIVDATSPVDLPIQRKADVPEEIWRAIRPEDFLPRSSLG